MYERIKALCNELGYSIPALEKLAILSNGAIGKWKNSIPRADILSRVATVLHTTSEYLLYGEGPAHPEKGNVAEIIVPDNSEIAEYLQKVKDEYGIMFDLTKTTSLNEIKSTVAFLKTIREQQRGEE